VMQLLWLRLCHELVGIYFPTANRYCLKPYRIV
jgi:hypothetical protein